MSHTWLDLAYRLEQAGEPFVLATVVWCERPTSAKPGACAIIQKDGQLTGWIGGSCSQPVVVRESLRILREGGDPCLLRLGSPESEADDTRMARGEMLVFPMTCASGGALDVFLEPHLPQPRLLLIGNSPVIAALAQLAPALDFAITQTDQADLSQAHIDERTYILVATHGQYDEDALAQALPGPAAYVGMVGSRRRAEACRAYLRSMGMAEQHVMRLKAPAGLDIGAITPQEIAASILAELVQVRRRGMQPGSGDARVEAAVRPSDGAESGVPADEKTARDPVCGMIVEIASARQRSTYNGQVFYFCCPACKRLFESDPPHYLMQH
jgi:xanthine dehydrogenase accessory factor